MNVNEQQDKAIKEAQKRDERALWSGRSYLQITADEMDGCKNVRFSIYRPDMRFKEKINLLASLRERRLDEVMSSEEMLCILSQLSNTFDIDQVIALEEHFEVFVDLTLDCFPAEKPRPDRVGPELIPLGDGRVCYSFCDHEDWPFDFQIVGYADLRDYPEWQQRLDGIGDGPLSMLISE